MNEGFAALIWAVVIALFIGLVLERTLTDLLELREPRLLDGYFDWLLRAMDRNPGVPAYIIAGIGIVLPVLPVLWIAHAFGANLLGLPYVAFASLVLVVSLGPRDLGREVRDYIAASEAGDPLSPARLPKEILESHSPTAPGGRVREVGEDEAAVDQVERPARGLLEVRVKMSPDEFAACLEQLRAGSDQRLRFNIEVELLHDDQRCATMSGVYVVWLK